MRRTYFVDTWFLIASIEARDSHHRIAQRLAMAIVDADLVTHDAVLTELLAYFSDEGSYARQQAARVVRSAFAKMEVISTSGELFHAALDRYEQRPDKAYSQVDCMSMIVMEQRGIRHVLTNDHHFSQAGFIVVNQ
jgi:predicted nucleic acid-binding protein